VAKIRALFRLPYLPLLVAPLILFSPVLLTGKSLYWGTPFLQFMPWRLLAWDTLRSGSWPLWNPLVGMGAPLLANYQSALLYPATWFLFGLQAIGGNALMAWGQTLVVVFHIIWAGIGMALLIRCLRLNVLAQTVGGLAFSLSGYLVARAGFLSINAAVAWLPWILYAGWIITSTFGRIKEKRRLLSLVRTTIPLILCLVLQLLAGHAQTTFYTLLLLAAWMVFWGWQAQKLRGVLSAIGYLLFSLAAAVTVSAVQLVPTAEYLLQSQRAAAVAYDQAVNYSFLPLRFLTLIAPDFFGNPAHGNYLLHSDNFWEDAIYIGFIPLIAAVGWIFKNVFLEKKGHVNGTDSSQPPLRALTIFLGVIILCSFILALGRFTPVFPFLYQNIPTFNLFQAPARFTLLAEVAMALLAAMGIHAWQRPKLKAREWTRRGIAVSIAVLLGSGLGIFLMANMKGAFVSATALVGVWGISAGFLSLYLPERESSKKVWSWIVISVVTLDLLISGWGLNPGIDSTVYSDAASGLNEVNSLRSGQRIYIDSSSENTLKFSQFFQFNDFTQPVDERQLLAAILPDSNMLVSIPSANNFDPMVPGRYARWMDYLSSQSDLKTYEFLLSLMDVGLVESVDTSRPDEIIYRAIPAQRLRWYNCIVSAFNEEDAWNKTMALGNTSGGDPKAVVVENSTPEESGACTTSIPTVLNVEQEKPDRIDISIGTKVDGWLMISSTWYPGWKAYIDGKNVPVSRADYLFMAVNVPGGSHQISLVYQPESFAIGGAVSLMSILLIILALVFEKRLN
jgi:hypothetical protein